MEMHDANLPKGGSNPLKTCTYILLEVLTLELIKKTLLHCRPRFMADFKACNINKGEPFAHYSQLSSCKTAASTLIDQSVKRAALLFRARERFSQVRANSTERWDAALQDHSSHSHRDSVSWLSSVVTLPTYERVHSLK